MYEKLGLGITLDFDDKASDKAKNLVNQFNNLINVSGKLVKSFNQGVSSLHFEGLTVAGFALERIAGRMDYYGKRIIRSFTAIGKAVIDTGAQFEVYQNIFDVFYKNQEIATKKLQWAMDYAARTPFEITDMLDTVKSMKAIGVDVDKTYTSATGHVRTLMDALGDLAALAPPTQGIKGMMIAIRNLFGGNERSFQMRMDIKPSQILGHAVGTTVEDITASLIELSEKLAPMMMEKLFGTWTQIINNFKDQWTRLMYAMSSSGSFNAAKKTLMDIYVIVNNLRGSDLENVAKNLSEVFTFLWKPVDLIGKALGKLILTFTKLSKEYPWLMKIISGIALSSGVFLVASGAVLKWCGVIIMAIAALATFYVNIIVYRLQIELFNNTIMRSIKNIGAFIKYFTLSAILFGGAIYMYEKNLFGFKDSVDKATEGIRKSWTEAWELLFGDSLYHASRLRNLDNLTKKFATIISLGRLVKILFTQGMGDNVFFTSRQKEDFEALGLWDLAKTMVMLRYRIDKLVEGISNGLKVVRPMFSTFFKYVWKPIKWLIELVDSLITKFTGQKSILGVILGDTSSIDRYEAIGEVIGKVLGLLLGFKALKTLGVVLVSPFVALSAVLTSLGEKIKWSGGLFRKAFGRTNNPFYYTGGGAMGTAGGMMELMNATPDNPIIASYSKNPFKRMKEQRSLYKGLSTLKLMEMSLNRGTQIGDSDAFGDPTQTPLNKWLYGQKNLVFGEEIIDVNGQKIKVPSKHSYYTGGGARTDWVNKWGTNSDKRSRLLRTLGTAEVRGNKTQAFLLRKQLDKIYKTNAQSNLFGASQEGLGMDDGYHTSMIREAYLNRMRDTKAYRRLSYAKASIGERLSGMGDSRAAGLFSGAKNKLGVLGGVFGGIGGTLGRFGIGAGKTALSAGGGLLRGAGAIGGGLLRALPGIGLIASVAAGVGSAISGGRGMDGLNENVNKATRKLEADPDAVKNFWENFKKGGIGTFSNLGGLIKAFVPAFKAAWPQMKKDGQKALESLGAWMLEHFPTVMKNITMWVWFKGIPLLIKGFYNLGKWIILKFFPELYSKGIKPTFLDAFNKLRTIIPDAISKAWEAVKTNMPSWAKKLFGIEEGTIKVNLRYGNLSYTGEDGKEHSIPAGGFLADKFNASGTNAWRGGLTWVGESGKELVNLPRGSQIYSSSKSKQIAGGGTQIHIAKVEVLVQADKLSRSDAKKQALMILEELQKLKGEKRLRTGTPDLGFA